MIRRGIQRLFLVGVASWSLLQIEAFTTVFTPRRNHAGLRRTSLTSGRSILPITGLSASTTTSDSQPNEQTVDVVVLGAGLGGLCCAGLTSKYGLETLCVEAHDTAGGCAHSFTRFNKDASKDVPFNFDSGPSLICGLSQKSTNPLRQVLDALEVADEIDWKTYDGWIVHDNADGKAFKLTTGDSDAFAQALEEKWGSETGDAFRVFRNEILAKRGLAEVSGYVPPFALRGGLAAVGSLAGYLLKLASIGTKGLLLTGPFSKAMDLYNVKDERLRKWFDYLAFALSGVDASHTQGAPVAYMMEALHKKDALLDYPMGGMDSLIQALVKGLEKYGGKLMLNSRVERFLLRDNRGKAECKGVVLANGDVIHARKGVVCNAPLWNMARILEDSVVSADEDSSSNSVRRAVHEVRKRSDDMCMTGSFMHLHLGIPSDGLPADLECHHSVLNFDEDVTAEQNMVIISIPTVFDPSLAPPGYHIVHAYTAACDSFDPWDGFIDGDSGKVGHGPNSFKASEYKKREGYEKLKEVRAQVLWRSVERAIPDVRDRAKRKGSVVMVGTPLTHRRYNQRFRGTYGPGPGPGKDVWELPGANTEIKGLLACGDTTFPGIGLPGVAASGTIAANTLTSIRAQTKLMKELKAKGALQ